MEPHPFYAASMKEFEVAVRTAENPPEETQKFEFKIAGDDHVYTAYAPTPSQFAVVLSKVGRHTTVVTKIAGVIDFFVSVLDETDASALTERLLDRSDPFEVEQVEEILSWLIEEWGGHPTQGPSDSATPSLSTGPTSTTTLASEGSTPSDYLSTVS